MSNCPQFILSLVVCSNRELTPSFCRKSYLKKIRLLNLLHKFEYFKLAEFPAHNPCLLIDAATLAKQQEPDVNARQACNYFVRTGVCKYANMCLYSHSTTRPQQLGAGGARSTFTTLIFPAMYTDNMLLGYELLKFNPDSGKVKDDSCHKI